MISYCPSFFSLLPSNSNQKIMGSATSVKRKKHIVGVYERIKRYNINPTRDEPIDYIKTHIEACVLYNCGEEIDSFLRYISEMKEITQGYFELYVKILNILFIRTDDDEQRRLYLLTIMANADKKDEALHYYIRHETGIETFVLKIPPSPLRKASPLIKLWREDKPRFLEL